MAREQFSLRNICFVLFLILPLQVIIYGLVIDGCSTEICRSFAANRARKQQERKNVLNELRGNFSKSDGNHWIGELPFQELIYRLQTRQISAVQVLSVFIGRTVNATDEFNCVTEFVPDAMKWAWELDSLPYLKGPLHGVPFCVKDDHHIKGMDTTMGYSRNLFRPATQTGTVVKMYQDLGAIPFCKTNVPQTLTTFGSDNPIFGATVNPLNKRLSPAGSSSGSGCLVGSRAIPFATGSDVGGSGRLPAHFNGISSIISTPKRLSFDGIQSSIPKLLGMNAVPVIFGDRPSTVTTIFKAMTENNIQNLNDPTTVPLPWRPQLFQEKRPLRFGYLTSMPFFPTMGDTPLVIEGTKQRLEALGHTVVPFEMPDGFKIMKTFTDIFFADRGQFVASQIKDDKIAASFVLPSVGVRFPIFQKKIAGLLPISGKLELLLRVGLDAEISTGLQSAVDAAKQMQKQILKQMQENNLDLLLAPVFPVPAVRLDDPTNLVPALCYVVLWNLVEFPVGTIPMGIESGRNIDAGDVKGDFFQSLTNVNLQQAIGMPIGVQIVGRPFQEELILRTLQELESSS